MCAMFAGSLQSKNIGKGSNRIIITAVSQIKAGQRREGT